MEVRMFREGDKERLISLLKLTFEGWHSESYWDWLYENNPQGKPSIGIAIDGEMIVASYSVCPVPILLGKHAVSVGVGIDAATHPRYRRKGLFEKVAIAAFANVEQRGFHYILGYSEWGKPAALGQVAKLGFRKVFMFKRVVKVLDWSRVLAFKANLPLHPATERHVTQQLKSVLREREDLDLSILSRNDVSQKILTPVSNDSISAKKSPDYIQWRYFDNPDKHYMIFASNSSTAFPAFAALTLRREQKISVGVIGDIFGNPDGWMPLLNGIETLMRLSGVPLLEVYASEAHRAIPLLASMRYRDRAFSLAGILRPTANTTPDEEQLTSRLEAWQTTLSDDPSL